MTDAFVSLARAASLIGKIPNLRMVPFNTAVVRANRAAARMAGWAKRNPSPYPRWR
jgi:hypothetical protein